MKNYTITIGLLFLLFISCKENKNKNLAINSVQSEDFNFNVETVVDGLEVPWSMAFLPDNSILITEQKGELIHFKNGNKTKVENVPEVYFRGQGGLLDIEIDPNYNENGWLYLSYASNIEDDNKGGNTTIMRAKLDNDKLIDKIVLYKGSPNTKSGTHFGSRIEFDKKGYLYFSIGDRYQRDVNPQDITKDGGKIYRINSDGSIPKDNPFYNSTNAKKAIYSYGHRNPQGMALHPVTGKIWTHEHGPQGGDEINIIQLGENYGWPKASFGINYSGTKFTDKTTIAGMIDPIHHWTPSIAPSGMTFVTSDKYPQWKGNLLVGSLKFQYLNRCVLKDHKVVKEEKLLEDIGRVRCVRQAPDGFIYVAVQNKGIVRLVPTL